MFGSYIARNAEVSTQEDVFQCFLSCFSAYGKINVVLLLKAVPSTKITYYSYTTAPTFTIL